ncbi:hypothetical protein J437_LFUL013080 [Ladona fulva]|uniref:Uncharacterized protein n=1 Tax=Ladona fulva TaxID=123851 RepID=A0A8K0KDV4_LADFU|nr:hypothetical protein J437_LFUL013080 [Ladona fulva]
MDLLCRVCVKDSQFYCNIYKDPLPDNCLIYEVINDVYDLKIQKEDGLPEFVCVKCLAMVKEFKSYKTIAQKGQLELMLMKQKLESQIDSRQEECFGSSSLHIGTESDEHEAEVVIKEEIFSESSSDDTDAASLDLENTLETNQENVGPVVLKQEVLPFHKDTIQQPMNFGPVVLRQEVVPFPRAAESQPVNFGPVVLRQEVVPFPKDNNAQIVQTPIMPPPGVRIMPDQNSAFLNGVTWFRKDGAGDCVQSSSNRMGKSKVKSNAGNGKMDNVQSEDRKKFACDVCQKSFKTRSALYMHRLIHTGEKPFECPHCGKGFNHRSNLLAHTRIHSEDKRYICDVCEKSFKWRLSLLYHKKSHSGDNPFKCHDCKLRFAEKSHLLAHLQSHSDDRKYACEECGAKFKARSSLNKHASVHSQEKHFTCPKCGKNFRLKEHLRKHLKVHSNENHELLAD